MKRERVSELHFITAFDNVSSIIENGIYCHNRMKTQKHVSVADASVQDRRASKAVPGGMRLHDYANLYFHARNVMLYVLSDKDHIAVLRIDPAVLDLDGVVVSDRNAASGAAVFRPVQTGLAKLDEAEVYEEWWSTSYDARQKRCAEVLVPGRVPPEFIIGGYVASDTAKAELRELVDQSFSISVDAHMFYRSG